MGSVDAKETEHSTTRTDQTKSSSLGTAMSATMLLSVPEVDLGIETKVKNIEATEEARQGLATAKRPSEEETLVPRFSIPKQPVNRNENKASGEFEEDFAFVDVF